MRLNLGQMRLALLVAGSLSIGCAKGTYLEVDFKGGVGLGEIRSINVDFSLVTPDGGVEHNNGKIMPGVNGIPAGPIKLPSSIAFKLDSEEGVLTITATAIGVQGEALATDSKTTRIMHGQTWKIEINFGTPTAARTFDDRRTRPRLAISRAGQAREAQALPWL